MLPDDSRIETLKHLGKHVPVFVLAMALLVGIYLIDMRKIETEERLQAHVTEILLECVRREPSEFGGNLGLIPHGSPSLADL